MKFALVVKVELMYNDAEGPNGIVKYLRDGTLTGDVTVLFKSDITCPYPLTAVGKLVSHDVVPQFHEVES